MWRRLKLLLKITPREESRYPGRHIAQKHLKKSLYQCPICQDFGSYESCTVTKHINKIHPEHCDAIPISNLDRYAQEIRDLQVTIYLLENI